MRSLASGMGLRVAAPLVVLWTFDDSRANGVAVNVARDTRQGFSGILEEIASLRKIIDKSNLRKFYLYGIYGNRCAFIIQNLQRKPQISTL